MLRIAITPPDISINEPAIIAEILDYGWDMVHLRHPNASTADMRRLIEAIPQRLHPRLRLHGHFTLTDEFNLGGLHLNSRCPMPPANYSGRLSLTCHSVDEVIAAAETARYDYVTLSPIFDSISKEGYTAAFTDAEIIRANSTAIEVVALGGVSPQRLPNIAEAGFGGYAVLGYLADAAAGGRLKEALGEFD